MAARLKRIVSNETEYLSYFWWKDHYRVETSTASRNFYALCQLCKMLNDPDEPVKIRNDLMAWWMVGSNCKSKGSYPWSKYTKAKYAAFG